MFCRSDREKYQLRSRALPETVRTVSAVISEYGAGAGQILNGYKGYVNGNLVTGTAVLATATVSETTLILTDGFPVSV